MAAIEVAILSPLIVLLLAGLLDFGLAAYYSMQVASAARAGAQHAIANRTDTAGITDTVRQAARLVNASVGVATTQFCVCSDLSSIDCTGTCTANPKAIYMRVSVQQSYSTIFTYPGVDNPMSLRSEVTVRVQ
ncbi:MAG: TadE/TadG family type IV pilus assembly protein [Pseudomonadota bacterium]